MNWDRVKQQVMAYAQFMSLESAAAKVKRNNLGRLDFAVDYVVEQIKKESAAA